MGLLLVTTTTTTPNWSVALSVGFSIFPTAVLSLNIKRFARSILSRKDPLIDE